MGNGKNISNGFGFVNEVATAVEAEEKEKTFRSKNFTCYTCSDAKYEEVVLTCEEHDFVSTDKIWDVHDLKIICDRNQNGRSKLSCGHGTKTDQCGRCDRCIYADRTIDAERKERTRGVSGTITIKTKLYHCKHMGRNDYCFPYFRCDKFKGLGERK